MCSWRSQTHKFILPPHRAISLNRPFCCLSFYLAESRAVVSIYWALWCITVGFPLVLSWRRRKKALKPEARFTGGWGTTWIPGLVNNADSRDSLQTIRNIAGDPRLLSSPSNLTDTHLVWEVISRVQKRHTQQAYSRGKIVFREGRSYCW